MPNTTHTCEICGEQVSHRKSAQYKQGRACKTHPEVQEVLQFKTKLDSNLGRAAKAFMTKDGGGLKYNTDTHVSAMAVIDFAGSHPEWKISVQDIDKFMELAELLWNDRSVKEVNKFMTIAVSKMNDIKSIDYLTRISRMSKMTNNDEVIHFIAFLVRELTMDNRKGFCDSLFVVLNKFVKFDGYQIEVINVGDKGLTFAKQAAKEAVEAIKVIEENTKNITVKSTVAVLATEIEKFVSDIMEVSSNKEATQKQHDETKKRTMECLHNMLVALRYYYDSVAFLHSTNEVLDNNSLLDESLTACFTRTLTDNDDLLANMSTFMKWADKYLNEEKEA